MKHLFLALAITGLTYSSAEAQSSANSKFAKNYPVCMTGSGYTVCDAATAQETPVGRMEDESASLSMNTTYIHMGNVNRKMQNRGRIRVSYDDPNAPYKGEESLINDGVQENKARNLNTNNGAYYDLPPSDGSMGIR